MSSLIIILLSALLALLVVLVQRSRKRLNYWHQLGIACEPPNFLLGNVTGIETRRSFAELWLSYYERFRGTGPFAGFYWFHRPSVFVLEPQLAKHILIKDFKKFADRGLYSNERDDPLTGHLFLLTGQKWRNMRSNITPNFTSAKMKLMLPLVVDVGARLVTAFDELIERGPIVEVKDMMARYTIDVIGSCAFGIECNSLRDPSANFHEMGMKSFVQQRHGRLINCFCSSFPHLARKLRIKQTHQEVEDFFIPLVRETVAQREQSNTQRNDFMEMLIQMKNDNNSKLEDGTTLRNLTLEEVAAHVFVFLIAGFETSATAMSFVLYELAQHEDVQERAREEIVAVLAEHNQQFTHECMKDMRYLSQVLAETLRLYTVLPSLNRECLEDFVVPWNPKYVIKRGMCVIIPANAIHRDPDFYPDPHLFNPDNFTPERVRARDRVEWMPFGDGPRNCIGMRFGQMQTGIGLALLLKHFRFSVCSQTKIPFEYDRRSFLIAIKGGINLRVEKV